MRRILVIPAVFVGCLIVIWVGTTAASNMPPQSLLAPTLKIAAEASMTADASDASVKENIAPGKQTTQKSNCTLPNRYPAKVQQWCHLIETASMKTSLPMELIAAVILQESGGDHRAYSSSGAVGLMQVMPQDGLAAEFMCLNGPCFASRPTIQELNDPAFNIAYGSQMLADLYVKHGSLREALFRYGPIDMGYAYADKVLTIWETFIDPES